jgi:hypothetical protein
VKHGHDFISSIFGGLQEDLCFLHKLITGSETVFLLVSYPRDGNCWWTRCWILIYLNRYYFPFNFVLDNNSSVSFTYMLAVVWTFIWWYFDRTQQRFRSDLIFTIHFAFAYCQFVDDLCVKSLWKFAWDIDSSRCRIDCCLNILSLRIALN